MLGRREVAERVVAPLAIVLELDDGVEHVLRARVDRNAVGARRAGAVLHRDDDRLERERVFATQVHAAVLEQQQRELDRQRVESRHKRRQHAAASNGR